eukprot:533163-Prorocentrum_minimum.AAC.1
MGLPSSDTTATPQIFLLGFLKTPHFDDIDKDTGCADVLSNSHHSPARVHSLSRLSHGVVLKSGLHRADVALNAKLTEGAHALVQVTFSKDVLALSSNGSDFVFEGCRLSGTVEVCLVANPLEFSSLRSTGVLPYFFHAAIEFVNTVAPAHR